MRDANVDVTHCGEGRRSKFTTTARARFIQIDYLQDCYIREGKNAVAKKFTNQLKIYIQCKTLGKYPCHMLNVVNQKRYSM